MKTFIDKDFSVSAFEHFSSQLSEREKSLLPESFAEIILSYFDDCFDFADDYEKLLVALKLVLIVARAAKNKFSIENEFKILAEKVKEKNDTLDGLLDNNFTKLKRILNEYLNVNKLKLFIILDDLKRFDNDKDHVAFDTFLKSIQSGFKAKNVKFIITTKIDKFDNYQEFKDIELKVFDKDLCMTLIEERKLNEPDYEWDKILRKMSGDNDQVNILPIKLDNLLQIVNKRPHWKYEQVVKYIENEMENPFSLMKVESPKLFECLRCLCLLEGRNISFELIETIFIDEKELDTILSNLCDLSELKYDRGRKCYVIHETTQIEIEKTKLSEKKLNKFLNKIILALNNLLDIEEIRKDKKKLNTKYEAQRL